MNTRKSITAAIAAIILCSGTIFAGKDCCEKGTDSKKIIKGEVIHLENDSTAEKELESIITKNDKVVVDFFATWCAPCKQLGPIIEQAAKAHADVIFVKIDTDKCQKLAAKYSAKSLPALIYFKDGEKINQAPGFKNKTQLNDDIKKYLN